MRDGRRRLLTTGSPRAATVGASMVASAAAVHRSSPGSRASPATVPATMVSGRPMPSRRAGTSASRRSRPRLTRTASQNSTRVRVASARWRTNWLAASASISPSARLPASSPMATNTMAWVTGVVASRPDTAA